MGLLSRIGNARDAERRRKATEVKQELANQLFVNPLCSDYENVFAQVQPLINDMKMVQPYGVGKNNGRLPIQRTPELAVLYSPNDEMGWVEFAGAMFATWLTEDELDIHVHFDRNKVIGYTILPPNCRVYDGNGDYTYQIRNGDGNYETLTKDEVMVLRFSRSPKNLQRGISPATAVRAWAQTEDVLAQYERAYIENGAVPASLTFIRASSAERFNAVRQELEGNLRGARNHNKTVYIWRQFNDDTGEEKDTVEVKTIQGNNSTLAIKELADIINDHLNKAYGVSNFILGDDSSAKYDNAELSDYQFIKRRVFPALTAFWNQFQFELDRVTGGLGYAIQFDIELPDLTERLKVKAETARVKSETLVNLVRAGAPPADAVKALGMGKEWTSVAQGVFYKSLAELMMDKKQKSSQQSSSQEDVSLKTSHNIHHHHTQPSASAHDDLPAMNADERKIYDSLLAMAERIFANSPNIDEEGVIREISETLNRRAELGAVDGAERLTKLLKNSEIVAELKKSIADMQISKTLKDRIEARTTELVNSYGETTREIMDDVLANSEGKSAGEIRKALRQAMPTWQAERIARTETVYAFKSGRLDEDKKVSDSYNLHMKLVWRCRHDGDTCDVCAGMDGQTVEVGQAFNDSINLPAGTTLVNGHTLETDTPISWEPSKWNDDGQIPEPHPNCRCYFDEIVEAE